LVPRRQHTRNKILRAGRATTHSPPTINRRYQTNHCPLNQPLRNYYCPIAGASSRFWRRSRRGISLAHATAKPESRVCHSPRRKNYPRQHKNTSTMAILPLSSAEVSPRDE
jgi:hypothetical protein